MEGIPPGDALPPPPQRATPARKGARCGAVAGSTHPHRPHPEHTGRGTLAARSRGRAVGRGTAPDTRRPSQRWKAPPPGTPFRHPHSEQRLPARAHAVGLVLGPHARIDRTRDTRVAEPWLPAPEDGRPGEGQRLTPGAPHNGGRHPPRGSPSATPTASNASPQGRMLGGRCWVHTPASTAPGTHGSRNPGCPLQRTGGRGGTAPDTRRPSERWKAAPPGTPFRHPHSEQRWPARAHAVGPVLGPHARIDRTRDTRVAEPWLPAPDDGRPGGGTAPDTRRPSQQWKAPPPGTPFRHSHSEQRRPARAHAVGPVLGPHARIDRTRDTRVAEPWLPAPEDRRPGEAQRLTPGAPHNGGMHPPPGTPFRHPHSEQRRPARAHAGGPVLGPHARIDRTRDTRVAEPWLPTPEDGRPGEGQRLTTGAPHNGGKHLPRGRPSATLTASNASSQGRTLWGR